MITMAICRQSRSISPPSPVHLFRGVRTVGPGGRKIPYAAVRILCVLKWSCKNAGIQSVARENVVVHTKNSPSRSNGSQVLKQEVCELIAKALEVPKSDVNILTNAKKQVALIRDLTVEYKPSANGTCFLGDLPEGVWASHTIKKLAECAAKE